MVAALLIRLAADPFSNNVPPLILTAVVAVSSPDAQDTSRVPAGPPKNETPTFRVGLTENRWVSAMGGQRAETWSLKPHALAVRQRPRRRRRNAAATSTAAGKNVPGSGTETDTLGTNSPPDVNVVASE
jgi:hypothetical protein